MRELKNSGERGIIMTDSRWIKGKGLELASEPVPFLSRQRPTRYRTQLVHNHWREIDPLAQAPADLRTSRTSVYGFQEERGIARE